MGEWTHLLLSIKHGPAGNTAVWWGPDRCGYVSDLSHAGRYSKEEAEEIANSAPEEFRSCYAVREASIAHLVNRVGHDDVLSAIAKVTGNSDG